MRLVTMSEFASMCEVSRQAVYDAVRRGTLDTIAEGKKQMIDLHCSLTAAYLSLEHEQRKSARLKKENKKTEESTKKKKKKKKIIKKEILEELEKDTEAKEEFLNRRPTTKAEADIQKTIVATDKMKFDLALKNGEIVPRQEVAKQFGFFNASVTDYFLPIGQRLAPLVAGIAGSTDREKIQQIQNLYDDEITRALSEIKRLTEESCKK